MLGSPANAAPEVPVEDARDREQTVLRYDTSHIQICRYALTVAVQNIAPERRADPPPGRT
jgi:hypothetical protein